MDGWVLIINTAGEFVRSYELNYLPLHERIESKWQMFGIFLMVQGFFAFSVMKAKR